MTDLDSSCKLYIKIKIKIKKKGPRNFGALPRVLDAGRVSVGKKGYVLTKKISSLEY